jgi:hypothetical protein
VTVKIVIEGTPEEIADALKRLQGSPARQQPIPGYIPHTPEPTFIPYAPGPSPWVQPSVPWMPASPWAPFPGDVIVTC